MSPRTQTAKLHGQWPHWPSLGSFTSSFCTYKYIWYSTSLLIQLKTLKNWCGASPITSSLFLSLYKPQITLWRLDLPYAYHMGVGVGTARTETYWRLDPPYVYISYPTLHTKVGTHCRSWSMYMLPELRCWEDDLFTRAILAWSRRRTTPINIDWGVSLPRFTKVVMISHNMCPV